MKQETAKKSLEFFYSSFANETTLMFYGGEPLLAWETIVASVNRLEKLNSRVKKKIHYSLATNGSLLTPEKLEFMSRSKFSLQISFDGPLHDRQRGLGQRGKLESIFRVLKQYPGISWKTNTVFSPENISRFHETICYILKLGVPEVLWSLSNALAVSLEEIEKEGKNSINKIWDDRALDIFREQLKRVKDYLLSIYDSSSAAQLEGFRVGARRGLFACFAGRDRLAVGPEGDIWGCFLFHDFFKGKKGSAEYRKYFLGRLDECIRFNNPSLYSLPEDLMLNQENLYTDDRFCFQCPELPYCGICPVAGAVASGSPLLGKIARWQCQAAMIKKQIREEFHSQLHSHRLPLR